MGDLDLGLDLDLDLDLVFYEKLILREAYIKQR
ncbi:hypothetical protein SVI_2130 [Shewanella violacea DSS12]|uniref:Uncharacterized protein n=1 Tax=Shewanella violacea (strain JCM 10179 / CIP 106290 / LMG 19151 / DSS12) TaxID=637905 RepID=D4ZKA2_SHEVD|nr:hypothetical protein SVI_2130 [Shewanella violacea DSS12]